MVLLDCGCYYSVRAIEEHTARRRAWWQHRDFGCGVGEDASVTSSREVKDEGTQGEEERD